MQVWAIAAGMLALAACSKSNNNNNGGGGNGGGGNTSTGDSTLPASISANRTLLSGKTYIMDSDLVVQKGATLYIQSGVTLHVNEVTGLNAKHNLIVKGSFVSLGTQAAPVWITTGTKHTDNTFSSVTSSLTTDSAFMGLWCGINCDTTCALFIMKWTHLEFCGGNLTGTPVNGVTASTASWAILYQNINGIFDLEDSWIYGSTDDAVRVTYGKINCMRNTFEKCGSNTGEAFNVKSGTRGDIAYNVVVGAATNAFKISDAGTTGTQCNVNCYNNTIVDCGYRQSSTSGHGGSINLEKGAQARIFNNLIVNCKIGLRIVSTADLVNATYGNTEFYGDSTNVCDNFYSVGDKTQPQTSDIPDFTTYLPAGYVLGAAYDGSSLDGKNSPTFKNFTLPCAAPVATNWATTFDFHLNSGSPAIGKGTTAFAAQALVPQNATTGASEIDAPGADIGAYQANGNGNKH